MWKGREEKIYLLQLATVDDLDDLAGAARLRAESLDLLHHVHALNDSAKDDVLYRGNKDDIVSQANNLENKETYLAIQPGSLHRGDEELRAVGVGA